MVHNCTKFLSCQFWNSLGIKIWLLAPFFSEYTNFNKNKHWTSQHYPVRITIIRCSHAFFKATNDVPKNVQLWQVYRTRIFDQAAWKLSGKYYKGLRSCYADRCLNLTGKNRGINDAHHWYDQRKRLRSLYCLLGGKSIKSYI
jgi:hypothetical protein